MSKKRKVESSIPPLEDASKAEGTWLMPIVVLVSLILLVHSGDLAPVVLFYGFIIGVLTSSFDLLRYSKRIKVDERRVKAISLVGYHVALLLFLVLVASIFYPYVYLGLLLIFLSHIWYGLRGARISMFAQIAIISLAYLITIDTPTYETFAYLFAVASIFVMLALVLMKIIKVATEKIQELSATITEVQVEHTKINSLINSMGDGVIVTDAEGKIVNYNGAALELVDTNESISNKKLNEYMKLTDKDGKKVDLVADSRKHSRTITRDDIILKLGADDIINLYVNISPIRVGYGEGSEKGYTLILRDITSQKSLEEERDEFISVVSHELRTPITITEGKISNAILTNDKGKKDKKVKKSLEEAHEQTLFLAAMINDLATLARAERDSLDMEVSLIEPAQLMSEIQANYKVQAEQKGLKLTVKTAKDLPSIDNSKLYIQEILQNFVTNSIKYTNEGTINISAKKGAKPGTVAFTVKDTGIGVSTSDKKRIFEKFFRSEDYRTRESSGTGLGLHITKKLTDKIDGEIDVQSKLNSGSSFTLTVGSIKAK